LSTRGEALRYSERDHSWIGEDSMSAHEDDKNDLVEYASLLVQKNLTIGHWGDFRKRNAKEEENEDRNIDVLHIENLLLKKRAGKNQRYSHDFAAEYKQNFHLLKSQLDKHADENIFPTMNNTKEQIIVVAMVAAIVVAFADVFVSFYLP
jgi:hypothetical protein